MALNVELLESSFAQIKVNSLTKRFYTLLFTDYPEVQPLFANTHMEKQSNCFNLVFTVNNLRKPDLKRCIERLGHSTSLVRCIAATLSMVGSSLQALR